MIYVNEIKKFERSTQCETSKFLEWTIRTVNLVHQVFLAIDLLTLIPYIWIMYESYDKLQMNVQLLQGVNPMLRGSVGIVASSISTQENKAVETELLRTNLAFISFEIEKCMVVDCGCHVADF